MKKEQQFIWVAAKFGFEKGNQGWQSTCALQEQEQHYYLFILEIDDNYQAPLDQFIRSHGAPAVDCDEYFLFTKK